jgi:hypothetical protein
VSELDAKVLREAVALACQSQNAGHIMQGRRRVAELPRDWVLANVEVVARSILDLGDYWEYGRFLELLDHVGAHDKVAALIAEGLKSSDDDVRDMAELWSERGRPVAG